MKKELRLLIATPLYPPDDGGPSTYAKLLETALPSHGVNVSLVVFRTYKQYPKILRHLLYTIALFRRARHADMIYALDPISVGVPAMIVSILLRKTLVLKVVGDYAWEQGRQRFGVTAELDDFVRTRQTSFPVRMFQYLERSVADRASVVVVPSKYLKKIVQQWGVDEAKIVVVYNAFTPDVPSRSKQELREVYGVDRITIISVGRMVPWKGFTGLMDAMAIVTMKYPDAKLLIAGSGSPDPYMRYANEKKYTFVEFIGNIEHRELMERMRASDCFALNTAYEGLSHLLLESMAVGVPVVTTAVGGNVELFEGGTRGVLVPYNDIEALAHAILEIVNDPKKAERYAEEGKHFVSNFTQEHMVEGTVRVLRSLVG